METLMSNAKPLDLSLPYQVADISLADFGKKEMHCLLYTSDAADD